MGNHGIHSNHIDGVQFNWRVLRGVGMTTIIKGELKLPGFKCPGCGQGERFKCIPIPKELGSGHVLVCPVCLTESIAGEASPELIQAIEGRKDEVRTV